MNETIFKLKGAYSYTLFFYLYWDYALRVVYNNEPVFFSKYIKGPLSFGPDIKVLYRPINLKPNDSRAAR